MGDYKNVSSKWKFGLLGLPDGSINIGTGGRLLVNYRIDGDKGESNIILTFGKDAYITNPEYDNDRFFFECLDPNMAPSDLCFAIGALGSWNMVMDAKSGGWSEGTFVGVGDWRLKDGKRGVVLGTVQTEMSRNGKIAWLTWTYPGSGLYAEGTTIRLHGTWEHKPLTPLQRVYAAVKPLPAFTVGDVSTNAETAESV
jgi:hypothetical protein